MKLPWVYLLNLRCILYVKNKIREDKGNLKIVFKQTDEPDYISGRLHSHLEKKYFAYAVLFVKYIPFLYEIYPKDKKNFSEILTLHCKDYC